LIDQGRISPDGGFPVLDCALNSLLFFVAFGWMSEERCSTLEFLFENNGKKKIKETAGQPDEF